MPTMAAHAAGTFCWPELGTTDQAAALKFYTDLFGWTVTEMPIPGGVYSMIKKGKEDVGAAYTLMDEMVRQGVPPNWMSYVATDDIDAACERVKKNGGQVVVGPMDVKPDGNHLIGRMAACMDPEGAAFSLWEAGSHIGTTVTGEPGSLCWNELWSRNPDAAYKFYASVFGWGSSLMDMGGMTYQMMMVGEQPGGGIMPMPADMPAPAHWLTYFAVDDADQVVAKAKASGAKVFMGPDDIPNIGRFAILSDPQGAVFAVIKLAQQ